MEVFQYSSEDEIFLHKKRITDNATTKKKSRLFIISTFSSLLVLTIFSLLTIRDTWVCELGEENNDKDSICNTLRRAVNCKTTVAPPIKAEVLLRINNRIKASAYAFCGWDTAVSEIRFCFIILSFLSLYIGREALNNNSKKEADIFCYSAIFFALLMLITSAFDFIQILDSRTNNYNLCNLANEFNVASNIDREMVECTFGIFNNTIIFSLMTSILLLLSSQSLRDWSKTIEDYTH